MSNMQHDTRFGRYPRDLAWWMFELIGWLNEWGQRLKRSFL